MSKQQIIHEERLLEVPGETFVTTRIELTSRAGKTIIAYLDVPKAATPAGLILVPPAYGDIKENYLFMSAYFAANGFQCLRFDWTDHVGESEGDIFVARLTKMNDDFLGLLDYAEGRWPSLRAGILATSLAGRVALKVASVDPRVKFLVLLAPVVNLQATLNAIYREDLIGNYLQGKRYGTLDVMGFPIHADGFLGDAVQGSLASISSAVEDAGHLHVPTALFVGERDHWVDIGEAQSTYRAMSCPDKAFVVFPNALHRFSENAEILDSVLKEAVHFAAARLNRNCPTHGDVHRPDLKFVQARQAAEKAFLRNVYEYSKAEEREFWKKYLSNFQYIINIHDYWNLLGLIYKLLGSAWPGQKVLDAGCGNGNYGLFLVSKQLYRVSQNVRYLTEPAISYVAADFIQEALHEASKKIHAVETEFKRNRELSSRSSAFVDAKFILSDLETRIPFADNVFDQICCNLVVSYLRDPGKTIQEFRRVLRPGGKIVISSLKPNTDLSEVYRNFVSVAENDAQVEEARHLLSNSGLIKLKEVRGIYHFYSEKELRGLMRQAGFNRTRIFRSFGDQANVAFAEKAL
ncbi:MAG TPA: methyltransferase domain-containing protein [Candidatus Binatia bacterium]|jgi:SAM-dependent methyltransferase/alpha-beta hydrolase superfamily lysophospholipase